MPKVRAKRSAIWLHFTEYNEEDKSTSVKCNRCNVAVPYSKNTTNLWSHLRIHHKDILENVSSSLNQSVLAHPAHDSTEQRSFSLTINNSPATVPDPSKTDCPEKIVSKSRDKVLKYSSDSKRAREITHSLIQMIAEDVYLFSIVNGKGFVNFVRALNEKYKLPDKNLLTSKYLPELYTSKRKEIEKNLSHAANVHLTLNLWTNANRKMFFLAITAHFYIDGTLQHNTLQISYSPTRYTAKNLHEILLRTADEWKITSKIRTIVRNSISNAATANTTPWRQISCFGHMLHLVVHNAIKSSEATFAILCKCRDVIQVFKTSNASAQSSRNQQLRQSFPKILSLKKDVPGRWNYAYSTLTHIIKLRTNIKYLSIPSTDLSQKDVPYITNEEWEIISGITELLKPLHEATKEMSDNCYVTISKIIPIVHGVEASLRNQGNLPPDVTLLRSNLLNELGKSFENIEAHPVYAVATFLDPRYKNIAFRSRKCVKVVENQLMNEYNNLENERKYSDVHPGNVSQATNENVETDDTLWAEFDRKVQETRAYTDYCSFSLKDELDRYLSLKVINRKSNPITWWNTEGNTMFPKLTKFALEYLCIPASSIPSEHLFSKVGQILSDRRTRLQPQHINMLAVLSSNRNK